MSVIKRLDGIDKMMSASERTKRLREVSMRAAFGMRKYVPMDENTLRASEPLNSKYDEGMLIWNTSYADTQYSVPMRHTTPGTTDHWDEAYVRNDGKDLAKYAESLYGGY